MEECAGEEEIEEEARIVQNAAKNPVKTSDPTRRLEHTTFSMLTDMSPSAAGQFYGAQIPAMGMNITNITHMQKPTVSVTKISPPPTASSVTQKGVKALRAFGNLLESRRRRTPRYPGYDWHFKEAPRRVQDSRARRPVTEGP